MYRIKPTVVRILVGVTISVALAWGAGPAYAGINSLYPADSSTLTAASQTFSWDGTDDITEYWLYLGTSEGEKDILDSGTLGTAPSTTVNGLPADGSTVYARLWHKEGGSWLSTDFTYTAFTASGGGGGEAGNHTLRWDRILDASNGDAEGCNSDRFKCIFPTAANPTGAAVLDNETGLVWERSPEPTTQINWQGAITHCAQREVGGRLGWELPLRNQLASLVDPSNSDLSLPTGHAFQNVPSGLYWSATTNVGNPTGAWVVVFINGNVGTISKANDVFVWCVRGGQSFDGNTHNTLH
jgi:hypothetical protein